MRNYREMTAEEMAELERLYPVTPNCELERMFGVSTTAIQKHIAYPGGWKKDRKAVQGQGHKRPKPGDKDIAWLRRHYKHTRNADIMARLGIGESMLHTLARRYGLKKSRQFMKKSYRQNNEEGMAVMKRYGIYEENSERARRQWADAKAEGRAYGFRKGESNKTRFSPRRYAEIRRKITESRMNTIRMERARMLFGLPRRTRLTIVVMQKYTKSQTSRRYNARQRGYILADDCSEGSGSRYTIYYDSRTQRSDRFERNLINDGFRLEPWTE